MDNNSIYAAKLTTPENAVAMIASGSLARGIFAVQPLALLKALADRAAGAVGDLRVYNYETAKMAGDTVLR